MKVLIVSKTQMNHGNICIGGLDLDNDENIRLFDSNGNNFPKNAKYNIGEIWDIDYKKKVKPIPPHIEDVLIINSKFIKNIRDIRSFLLPIITPWRGSPSNLFQGKLNYTNYGAAYIDKMTSLPKGSVGFWIPDKNLQRHDYDDNVKYEYRQQFSNIIIKFKGLETPLNLIRKDTLLRLSLARWYDQNGKTQDRCYLQLSGWYL